MEEYQIQFELEKVKTLIDRVKEVLVCSRKKLNKIREDLQEAKKNEMDYKKIIDLTKADKLVEYKYQFDRNNLIRLLKYYVELQRSLQHINGGICAAEDSVNLIVDLTVEDIFTFDESHPCYSSVEFLEKLLAEYENIEAYEKCPAVIERLNALKHAA